MTAAALLLIVLSPVFAVLSIAIKLHDRGPAFFVHRRIGQYGRPIEVLKFRTMVTGAHKLEEILTDEELEEYYKEYKLRNDPRITELGVKLRRHSLDELPQLINVLKGDMSLVGPRPLLEHEYSFYTEEQAQLIKSVPPGITGYWQVNGRNNATYESGERQKLELYYIEHASLLMDLGLMVRTIGAVVTGRGAH